MSSRGSAEKTKVATISELSYEEYERNSVHVTVSYADDVMKSYAGLSVVTGVNGLSVPGGHTNLPALVKYVISLP